MKFLTCIAFAVAIIGVTGATSTVGSSSPVNTNANANQDLEPEVQPVQSAQFNNEFTRFRKAVGYGAASIPAPPCPKNYLFSCQPNLAPVPCSAPASYGSGGAYSVPVPSYVAPLGVPHNPYASTYNGFVPQPVHQFY